MKNIIAVLMLTLTSVANAVLLTFDDIEEGSLQNKWATFSHYQGFNFSHRSGWVDVVDSPWNYGARSGEFALFNPYGGSRTITQENGDDFTFDGMWAKHWGKGPESGGNSYLTGALSGYNNGNLIWSVTTHLNGSYQFFDAQVGAIDELRLELGDHFVVDDISLNGAQAVSNPISLLLFGTGLLGVVYSRKKVLTR